MKRVVGFVCCALFMIVVVVVPTAVWAEAVECPNCWRMIDDGPCRCPHCSTALPGRTCTPEQEAEHRARLAKQRAAERGSSADDQADDGETPEKSRSVRRADRPGAETDEDEPAGKARPRRRPSTEAKRRAVKRRPASRSTAKRRVRRRRPPEERARRGEKRRPSASSSSKRRRVAGSASKRRPAADSASKRRPAADSASKRRRVSGSDSKRRPVRRRPPPQRRGGARDDGALDESPGAARRPTKRRVVERRPRERRPDEGEPPARGREVHDVDDEEDAPIVDGEEGSDEDAEDYSKGPHFLLGYRYLGLYDWIGEGHTNALSIEGFPLAQRISWLRIGLGLDVGFRRVDPHTDWLMRGFVTLGFQYPRRVTPYGAFTVGGGTMYRKRFGQGMTDGLFSFNVDAGATFKITRTFVADLSVGYMYSLFADLQFNSVTFRFAIGW